MDIKTGPLSLAQLGGLIIIILKTRTYPPPPHPPILLLYIDISRLQSCSILSKGTTMKILRCWLTFPDQRSFREIPMRNADRRAHVHLKAITAHAGCEHPAVDAVLAHAARFSNGRVMKQLLRQ